ncbi:MAG TPA: hypothetical protein VHV51_21890 [Polyangiaceae bacterium]|jgi:hypothetical protein|nr:hypothetical protein [Polyangiaceae bacterium]
MFPSEEACPLTSLTLTDSAQESPGFPASGGELPVPATVVTSTPLQYPSYEPQPDGGTLEPNQNTDPSTWDRSPLPAGACVFRVQGLSAACLLHARIIAGPCNASVQVGLINVSDVGQCGAGAIPGCSTSDPWRSGGDWWYVQADGTDYDIVMCAPECAQQVARNGGACLTPE